MKKDLLYILKRVVIGVLISIVLFSLKSCNVNALSIPAWTGKFNNRNTPTNATMSDNSTETVSFSLGCNEGINCYDYTYVYSDICTTGGFTFSLSNSNPTASCSGGCLGSNIYKINTGLDCTANGYSGSVYRVYFPVRQWDIGSGNTNYYLITESLKLKNTSSWTNFFVIGNFIFTDDDPLTLNISVIQNSVLNSTISSLNSSIISSSSQAHTDSQNTQNAINNVNSTLNDDEIDNPDFEQFDGYFTENGVITNLILVPVNLYRSILNNINGSCNSFNLGSLFGTNLIMPCINIGSLLGSTLWGVVDILFSGIFVFTIAKKMIKVFNNMTSMEEGDILD